MKIKLLIASIALAVSGTSMAAVDLGVLDASGSSFSRSFSRVFGFGSPTGNFTDHYTFSLASPAGATGGLISFDTGSLTLAINSVSLSGLSGLIGRDTSPGTFTFSNLAAGNYSLSVAGNLRDSFLGGSAGYSGSISSTGSIASAAPEPEAVSMALAGLIAVGLLARRRKQG